MSTPLSISDNDCAGNTPIPNGECDHAEEAESLRHPLLSDNQCEGSDEEIVSQLMSATERPIRRRRWLRSSFWVIFFGCCTWFGFMASLWAAYSCNIILIDWNEGGVHLSITGLGLWQYQQVGGNHENIGENSNHEEKTVCVPYGGGKSDNLQGFFPMDNNLRIYSILPPSLSFSVILSVIVYLMVASVNPDTFTRFDGQGSPRWKYATIARIIFAIFVGLALTLSDIFQLLTTYGLLNLLTTDLDSEDQSPMCNPKYSSCRFGPGGYWAIFAATNFFVSGVVAFWFAHAEMGRFDGYRRWCR